MTLKRRLAGIIRQINTHADPVLKTAGHIGAAFQLASNPNPLAVVGAVSKAIQDLDLWAKEHVVSQQWLQWGVSTKNAEWRKYLFGVFEPLVARRISDFSFDLEIDGRTCRVNEEQPLAYTTVMFQDENQQAAFVEFIDRQIPRVLVFNDFGPQCERPPVGLDSPRAQEILRLVAPMVSPDGNRSILLHGRPGVGKSRMAMFLAERLARVRIRVIPNGALRHPRYTGRFIHHDITIIDDIDKVSIDLGRMEQLANTSALTIYTANNAMDDRVLDGAATRCGRIDESFLVDDLGQSIRPEPPLDALDGDTYERIRHWPAAALDEIRSRILARGVDPKDLRLDEIERRLGMACRSVKLGVDSKGAS